MVDSGKREQIQSELIEFATSLIDGAENMPLVLEDQSQGRRIHQEWKDGEPIMVHYLSVDEIVPADYVNWFKQSDYLANWKTIAPSNVTCTEIEADGGK